MNYKIQLQAFLVAALFTAAALLLPACTSSGNNPAPAEPLPVELYD